jgi:D-alanyl-D-alanine carboxypeptidase/D-alanyl-D-alanine-endopeptidase (penicillin-binding protein 4)
VRVAAAGLAVLLLAVPAGAAAGTPVTEPHVGSSAPAAAPALALAAVTRHVDALEQFGRVAVYVADVTDPGTPAALYSRNGTAGMLPASTAKILTAASALEVLGPAVVLATTVRVAGPGRVVLTGGGDPLLSSTDLGVLARVVARWWAAAGQGEPLTVQVDDTLFGEPVPADGWDAGYQPYDVAPVRPLAVLGEYSWRASRTAFDRFASELGASGVRVVKGGRASSPVPQTQAVVASRGHTVEQAVRVMLGVSENNVAEVLHRHVGLAAGMDQTWDGAARGTLQVLGELGVDTAGLVSADGSGASRANRVSARALTAALAAAADSGRERLAALFYGGGLPLAGVSGTLGPRYDRFRQGPSSCARGAVAAKTGTLRDAYSLAGIATTATGRKVAFAFLVNGVPRGTPPMAVRHALDELAAVVQGCLTR